MPLRGVPRSRGETVSDWSILAVLNPDEPPEAAVSHADAVARSSAGQVTFLSVLNDAAGHGAGRSTLPGPRVVILDDPAERIARYADWIEADVILMISQRRMDWTRIWRKSITDEVLALSNRPVQLADPAQQAVSRCRSILCVVKLDGSDGPMLDYASRLAARSNAEIELMHVVPEASEGLLHWGTGEVNRPLSSLLATNRVHALAEDYRLSRSAHVLNGPLYKSIAQTARKTSADLVITGRAPVGVRDGTYPKMRAVFRRVNCSVLSVPVFHTMADPERLRKLL